MIRVGTAETLLRVSSIAVEKKDELAQAIMHGNTGRIRKLEAENPGIINEKDRDGKPMFFNAIDKNQMGSLTCMYELGMDLEVKDKHRRNGLHIAGMQRRREIAEFLVQLRVRSTKDDRRKRPSYWAAKAGDTALAILLRKHELSMAREKVHERQKSRSITQ